jgi:enamine deaminase RidA (YjgF/YER057c/UK114 family)
MAAARSFVRPGGTRETYIHLEADRDLDFAGQLRTILERYAAEQAEAGLDPNSAVFRRVFLSDALNQAAAVRESALCSESVATSIVEQRPLKGGKLAVLAYHIDGPDGLKRKRLSPRHLMIEKSGKRYLWSARLSASDADRSLSSDLQTSIVFDDLIRALAAERANLRDHCLRTWIYIKNVDIFYHGMVERRRKLFNEHGLTNTTHFIASTGIEGSGSHRYDVVAMDAYSCLDIEPRQISFLNDFDRLCATKDYNVTFERATRVAYADRAHIFVSGTASIDAAGDVAHRGDVGRQLDRALTNVEALLRAGRASLADMSYLIVYLRDPADLALVEPRIEERFRGVPVAIVKGAVCRPEWLIEVEGVAITANDEASLPRF